MSTSTNAAAPTLLAAAGTEESAASGPLPSALHKVTWRLIPFMFLLYVVAYLDRVNVGFAQLQMKQALSLSDGVYGFGSGLFFIGYFLFEVPSNLLLERFGPRRWIARIMITWGVLSAAMLLVRGPLTFYALRFLLGLAEAGFFPGMILYLTYWFPPRQRAGAVARFMTAISISQVVGAPLSGLIMDKLHGVGGWGGWQWLFLLEGLPSVVLGFVVLAFLPDKPDEVKWLDAGEKAALRRALEAAAGAPGGQQKHTFRDALADGRVWLLAGIYFTFSMGLYGLTMWVPQILKDVSGGSTLRVGMLTAIPYAAAMVAMVSWGRFTDVTGAYRRNLTITTGIAGTTILAAAGLLQSGTLAVVLALCVATMALYSSFGPFWALPTSFLRGTAAAGGIAVINSLGNLGGFVSPSLLGFLKQRTHSFAGGIATIGVALLAACLLIAWKTRSSDRVGA